MTDKLASLAVVTALALGLAACGSSGTEVGSASPTASMSSTTAPSPTATPSATTQSAEAMIAIKDFAYEVPATVAPGATVTITNADSQAHSITSKVGGFDVKVDGKGTAVLTAPSKPGKYPFVCTFHGNMTGTLVVA